MESDIAFISWTSRGEFSIRAASHFGSLRTYLRLDAIRQSEGTTFSFDERAGKDQSGATILTGGEDEDAARRWGDGGCLTNKHCRE